MNKKQILTIAALVLIGTGAYFFVLNWQRPLPAPIVTNFEECERAGYPVGESHPKQCWTSDGRRFVEEIDEAPPALGHITVSGEITCLPKIGRGAQTLECAIGLQDADGQRYGLRNLFNLDREHTFSQVGLRVTVSGTFSPEEIKGPDGNRYDVVGVIDVVSIQEAGI